MVQVAALVFSYYRSLIDMNQIIAMTANSPLYTLVVTTQGINQGFDLTNSMGVLILLLFLHPNPLFPYLHIVHHIQLLINPVTNETKLGSPVG